jgi:hypothetical protein
MSISFVSLSWLLRVQSEIVYISLLFTWPETPRKITWPEITGNSSENQFRKSLLAKQ